MLILLLASTLALAAVPVDEGTVPVEPLDAAITELGQVIDVERGWMVTLRVLPIPESHRMFHAPRPPWRLNVVRTSGLDPVLLADSEVTRSGWGAPQFAAVGAGGSAAITWRPGRKIALFSPAGTRSDLTIELPYGHRCAHLEVDGVIHAVKVGEDRVALTWRGFDANGLNEPIDLGVATTPRPGTGPDFEREADRLVWVRGEGELASLDIERREVTVIPCAGVERFTLDSIHDGVLLAHSNEGPEALAGATAVARLVDLSSGRVLEQPVASMIAAFTPLGWITGTQWIDPVEGTRGTLEHPIDQYERMVQVSRCELWTGGRSGPQRVTLRLDEEAIPPADNAAAMTSIEAILAGDRTETMREALGRLALRYSDACVALLDRVAGEFDDVNDRRAALRRLGASRHPNALELLLRHLADEPNWWNRMTTVGALADLGDPTCVPAILRTLPLEELEGDRAAFVANALAVLGSAAASGYLDRLFERTRDTRVGAARERLALRAAFLLRLKSLRD
ncbi:MAG: HEAT repeat domain-containing protein [Planctomycetota bacterium]